MAVKNGIGLESDQVEHIGGDGEIERGGRAKDQEEIFHFVFLSFLCASLRLHNIRYNLTIHLTTHFIFFSVVIVAFAITARCLGNN